jgi:PhoPQ-activated pathogenicity-related protein
MKENRGRGIKENSRDYKNAVGVENNLMKIGKEGDNKIKIAVRSCRFHIS